MDRDDIQRNREEFLEAMQRYSEKVDSWGKSIKDYKQYLDEEMEKAKQEEADIRLGMQALYIEQLEGFAEHCVEVIGILRTSDPPKPYEVELHKTFVRRLEQLKNLKKEAEK